MLGRLQLIQLIQVCALRHQSNSREFLYQDYNGHFMNSKMMEESWKRLSAFCK